MIRVNVNVVLSLICTTHIRNNWTPITVLINLNGRGEKVLDANLTLESSSPVEITPSCYLGNHEGEKNWGKMEEKNGRQNEEEKNGRQKEGERLVSVLRCIISFVFLPHFNVNDFILKNNSR